MAQSVVVLGDSQGQGLAPHLPGVLAAVGPVRATAVQPGISTRAFLDSGKIRQAYDAAGGRPDLVIVALGGNDTAGGTYPSTLRAFVNALRVDGALPEVWWVGPAYSLRDDVDERHAATSRVQSQVLPGLGVHWLDGRRWTQSGHRDDGVHFDRPTYGAWALGIATEIRRAHSGYMSADLLFASVGLSAALVLLGLGVAFAARQP